MHGDVVAVNQVPVGNIVENSCVAQWGVSQFCLLFFLAMNEASLGGLDEERRKGGEVGNDMERAGAQK